jgi:hypothetical protein
MTLGHDFQADCQAVTPGAVFGEGHNLQRKVSHVGTWRGYPYVYYRCGRHFTGAFSCSLRTFVYWARKQGFLFRGEIIPITPEEKAHWEEIFRFIDQWY